MAMVLHILNGDSTRYLMEKSSVEGDHLVWREMLCDGPLKEEVGSDPFWMARYKFYQETLQVSKLEYYDRVIKELVLIEDLSHYKEVVLWFEYDLFCQVNLLAACSYLLRYYKKDIAYYLVCVGREKNKEGLVSLGHFSAEEFSELYTEKIKLSRADLVFADAAWKLFSNGSSDAFKDFDFDKNKKFKYLKKAVDQHIENRNLLDGLTGLERQILAVINEGNYTRKILLRALLNWQQRATVNGFGDLQYQLYLEKLKPYYTIDNEVYALNRKGLEALK